MLRRIMEANKTNVRSARFFTNITSPTSWNVRIEAVYIPRIEMAGVGDEGGFIQGEWVDHRPTTKRLERGNVMSKGHGKPLAPTSAPSAAQAEVKIDIENDKITGQKVILYMHGGAFMICSPKTHRWVTWRLSKRGECKVLAISYAKAPEHTYPEALHDTLSTYFYLINVLKYSPLQIFLGGDSAGAGLCVSTCLYLSRNGHPLPKALILFSPWLDLTHSMPSYRENAEWDYIPADVVDPAWLPRTCSKTGLEHTKQYYAPDGLLQNPLVSPLFADLDELRSIFGTQVKVWIGIGEIERLRDEAMVFWLKCLGRDILTEWEEKRAKDKNGFSVDSAPSNTDQQQALSTIILDIYADVPHVPPLFFKSDISRTSLQRVGDFIQKVDDIHGSVCSKVFANSKHDVSLNEVAQQLLVGLDKYGRGI